MFSLIFRPKSQFGILNLIFSYKTARDVLKLSMIKELLLPLKIRPVIITNLNLVPALVPPLLHLQHRLIVWRVFLSPSAGYASDGVCTCRALHLFACPRDGEFRKKMLFLFSTSPSATSGAKWSDRSKDAARCPLLSLPSQCTWEKTKYEGC